RTCTSSCCTPHSTISTTTPISDRAAHCRTSASRRSSTSPSAPTGSPPKPPIRRAGTGRYQSRTRTSTAIPPSRRSSGRNAWRAIRPATPPTPPSLRAPNGVLEDSFYQATGRPLWHAANIYAPTLLIAGAFDTWSFPEDREGLMRDLVHAPAKKSVLIPNATHFVLFEKPRF